MNSFPVCLILFLHSVLLYISTSAALSKRSDPSLNVTSSRLITTLTNTDVSSLANSPYFRPKNPVHVETPLQTGTGYRVSSNFIRVPSDLSTTIAKATAEKKPLEVFAVHLYLSGHVLLNSIPYVKIISHNCVFGGTVYFSTNGSRPSYTPMAASIGVTPRTPPSATHSGHVDFVCGQVTTTVRSPRLSVYSYGMSGFTGGRGGAGRNGIDGTPGSAGRCKSKKIFGIRIRCKTTRGVAGRPSTAGSNGARGGRGGNGGNGGNFNMVYGSIAKRPLYVSTKEHGGTGGRGGSGGVPGKNGKYIAPINYVSSCSGKCKRRYALENRPTLPALRTGLAGLSGTNGRSGYVSVSNRFSSLRLLIKDDDILRLLVLAERYYNDLVLAGRSFAEAESVMRSIASFVSLRKKATGSLGRGRINPMIKTIGERALVAVKTLRLEQALFGPAVLSRNTPSSIGDELSGEFKYMSALRDQMVSSKLQSDIMSVVTAAAAISIPATNFGALRRDLQSQRDTFRRGVVETEARLSDASATIQVEMERFIAKKKDEIDNAKQSGILKTFNALKSIVNLAMGVMSINFASAFASVGSIIGTIKDIEVSFKDIEAIKSTVEGLSDDFKSIKGETAAIKELLTDASGVKDQYDTVVAAFKKEEAKPVGSCAFTDIKKLLQDAPDRIDKFPNLVNYDADFSLIDDIGVVSDLSKALIGIRASKLTSQFGCVLGEKLDDVPAVKTAFDNFFALTATRIDILSRMVDIDIELRRLSIVEEGVLAQKSSLQTLRTSIGVPTRGAVLAVLGSVYENTRLRVLETMERLANSYENIVLRDMKKLVRAFAVKQLSDNGVCGFDPAKQYSAVLKLHIDLKNAYQVAHRCTSGREIPSYAYYSYDITADDSPELFANGGPKMGDENGIAIKLDIENNCAFYGGDQPPKRGAPNTLPSRPTTCFPNLSTYNARMTSIAVELIGGDQALLPPGKTTAFSTIDQVGAQTFHASPGTFKALQMTPLQFALGFLSLKTGSSTDIVYHNTCLLGRGGLTLVDVDKPRVCPSPYSTYSLHIGHVKDATLGPYLASVKAIRIHTQLVTYLRRDTASICFE